MQATSAFQNQAAPTPFHNHSNITDEGRTSSNPLNFGVWAEFGLGIQVVFFYVALIGTFTFLGMLFQLFRRKSWRLWRFLDMIEDGCSLRSLNILILVMSFLIPIQVAMVQLFINNPNKEQPGHARSVANLDFFGILPLFHLPENRDAGAALYVLLFAYCMMMMPLLIGNYVYENIGPKVRAIVLFFGASLAGFLIRLVVARLQVEGKPFRDGTVPPEHPALSFENLEYFVVEAMVYWVLVLMIITTIGFVYALYLHFFHNGYLNSPKRRTRYRLHVMRLLQGPRHRHIDVRQASEWTVISRPYLNAFHATVSWLRHQCLGKPRRRRSRGPSKRVRFASDLAHPFLVGVDGGTESEDEYRTVDEMSEFDSVRAYASTDSNITIDGDTTTTTTTTTTSTSMRTGADGPSDEAAGASTGLLASQVIDGYVPVRGVPTQHANIQGPGQSTTTPLSSSSSSSREPDNLTGPIPGDNIVEGPMHNMNSYFRIQAPDSDDEESSDSDLSDDSQAPLSSFVRKSERRYLRQLEQDHAQEAVYAQADADAENMGSRTRTQRLKDVGTQSGHWVASRTRVFARRAWYIIIAILKEMWRMFWKWLNTLVLEIRDTFAPVDNPHSTYETGQSFVYPVRMLAAFWITMSLMIVMVGISWIAFGKLRIALQITLKTMFNLSDDTIEVVKTITIYAGSGGAMLSVAIASLSWFFILQSFRRHTFLLRQGKYWFKSTQFRASDAYYYIGYQVSHTVFGFLIVFSFVFVIILFSVAMVVFPEARIYLQEFFRGWFVDAFLQFSLPTYVIQWFLRIVFSRKGRFIRFRALYQLWDFISIYQHVITGLILCVFRLVIAFGHLLAYFPRLDTTHFPIEIAHFDPGYSAYMGMVLQSHVYTNPVLREAVNILRRIAKEEGEWRQHYRDLMGLHTESGTGDESCKDGSGIGSGSGDGDGGDVSTSPLIELADEGAGKEGGQAVDLGHAIVIADQYNPVKRAYRRTLRNRWWLLITLYNNPSLIQHRAHIRKVLAQPGATPSRELLMNIHVRPFLREKEERELTQSLKQEKWQS